MTIICRNGIIQPYRRSHNYGSYLILIPKIENGLRLGWLINPQDRQVEIYRPLKAAEVMQMPVILSGEDMLPGFELQV